MNCPFPVFLLWNIAIWIPNAAQAPPAYHPIQFPCFNGFLNPSGTAGSRSGSPVIDMITPLAWSTMS